MDWGQWWGGLVNWWLSIDWTSNGGGAFISAVAVLVTFVITRILDGIKEKAKDRDHKDELRQAREDRRLEIEREEKRHAAEVQRLTEESERQRRHQKEMQENDMKLLDKQETISLLYEYELQARELERIYTSISLRRNERHKLKSRIEADSSSDLDLKLRLEFITGNVKHWESDEEKSREALRDLADQINARDRQFSAVMAGFSNFTAEYANHEYLKEDDIQAFSNERQRYIEEFHDKLEEYKKSSIV